MTTASSTPISTPAPPSGQPMVVGCGADSAGSLCRVARSGAALVDGCVPRIDDLRDRFGGGGRSWRPYLGAWPLLQTVVAATRAEL